MYIFVDEYGNMGPPPRGGKPIDQRMFILGALVIPSTKALRRVSLAVTRARMSQVRTPQHSRCKPCARELKGEHLLAPIRRKLFKRIARIPGVHFYCLLIDKAQLKQQLRQLYSQRYNRAVANLLARMPFPRKLARVFLVIDLGGGGGAQQQRQTLTDLFKNSIKKRATHVAVRVRESHSDRCLQAVDALTNFAAQSFRLREKIDDFRIEQRNATLLADKRRLEKKLTAERRHLQGWQQAKNIMRGRMHLWQLPPGRLYTKSLRKLVRARITAVQKRKKNEANRRG
jgi:Protein of unknown function (DUF3800)